MGWVDEFKPRQVYFTHMSIQVDYDQINDMTPHHVGPAYDGLIIEV
jgi:phosphoribosyl 1,2-cyclic phosphate phosphodiesterase